MKSLNGKVAVITGGNSGIGYSTAKELKENGAKVIITGRRKEAIERAAQELNVTGLIADQSNLTDINALVNDVTRKFGKIDILLINAGITKFSTIETMPETIFDEVMNVNFKGAYFTLSKFIPIMNINASVILLSSTSAHISPPQASVYAASKAALNAVMKIAALELADRKIRVNAVSPGPVSTAIMDKIGLDQKLEDQMTSTIPLSRFGKPAEVAKLIAFLASDNAAFINGSEYLIDGGQCV
ncbi:short-chain dehydrogenase [Pedobacter ginsengisoli]|uniref:Short-chain dehydrogenase n=1 Tax=Pedobacter ginsengisoli TaxID=363852 RepID=A0A2D1U6B8_9SPHI|nr:glucose 1-dehydrogenase [Pedobacter ginsengisoli]ATP57145.1 short-chain dehydrogenase [Pedobacter ginsengisoli]